jgi:KDO2-lipid IV(A) lauroyltransferase
MAASRLTALRRAIRAHAVLLLLRAIGLLPFGVACALGRAIGRVGFVAARHERAKALAHLALAFPEKSEAERIRLARGAFEHLAQCTVEIAQERHVDAWLAELVELPDASSQLLRDALAEGKGVVMVTAHVGNWELMGRRIARDFGGLTVVAREMNAPPFTDAMDALRARAGIRTLWRGRPGATKEMLRVFRDKGMLALLIDQDTRVQSVFVPFFGRLASTPRAAGDLAARFGTPMLGAFVHRAPGNRHRIEISRIDAPRTGDRDADGLALTRAATGAIERAIRESPAEWVWMHERWKTQPGETTDEPDEAAA